VNPAHHLVPNQVPKPEKTQLRRFGFRLAFRRARHPAVGENFADMTRPNSEL